MNISFNLKAVSLILVIAGIMAFSWSPFFLFLSLLGIGLHMKLNIARKLIIWTCLIILPLLISLLVAVMLTVVGLLGTRLLYGGRSYGDKLFTYLFMLYTFSSVFITAYIYRIMIKEDVRSIFDEDS